MYICPKCAKEWRHNVLICSCGEKIVLAEDSEVDDVLRKYREQGINSLTEYLASNPREDMQREKQSSELGSQKDQELLEEKKAKNRKIYQIFSLTVVGLYGFYSVLRLATPWALETFSGWAECQILDRGWGAGQYVGFWLKGLTLIFVGGGSVIAYFGLLLWSVVERDPNKKILGGWKNWAAGGAVLGAIDQGSNRDAASRIATGAVAGGLIYWLVRLAIAVFLLILPFVMFKSFAQWLYCGPGTTLSAEQSMKDDDKGHLKKTTLDFRKHFGGVGAAENETLQNYKKTREFLITKGWEPLVRANPINGWRGQYPENQVCHEGECTSEFIRGAEVLAVTYALCEKDTYSHIEELCQGRRPGFQLTHHLKKISLEESNRIFQGLKQKFE